ncbi:MAG: MgtC/SapB family protein [Proteobacteria bacterium]|nr:MgtC/SapB family protein [Pseudomonadota bacterium]
MFEDLFSGAGLALAAQWGVSVLCGGMIGLERQLLGKAIGIRTSILICLGTQVFVSLGAGTGNPIADPTRVLGQVVTGVGFLGAGVILARGGAVTGVTSAAVVWILAAIGSMNGLGYPIRAVGLAFLTLFLLIGIRLLEKGFKRLRGGSHEPEEGSQADA